jgi:hypothetical protein
MTPEKTSDRITEMFLGDRPPDGNAQAGHWDAIAAEVLAQVESAISQAIEAARAEEKKKHGSFEARCVCPGCPTMVPGCWQAGVCLVCAAEDCDHDEPAATPERQEPERCVVTKRRNIGSGVWVEPCWKRLPCPDHPSSSTPSEGK